MSSDIWEELRTDNKRLEAERDVAVARVAQLEDLLRAVMREIDGLTHPIYRAAFRDARAALAVPPAEPATETHVCEHGYVGADVLAGRCEECRSWADGWHADHERPCPTCDGRGEVAATLGQPGDGPMPCPTCAAVPSAPGPQTAAEVIHEWVADREVNDLMALAYRQGKDDGQAAADTEALREIRAEAEKWRDRAAADGQGTDRKAEQTLALLAGIDALRAALSGRAAADTHTEALRALRGSRSQAEMAALFGRTQTWWSYIENGRREPCIADLEKLSRMGLTLHGGSWSITAAPAAAEGGDDG